LAGRKFGEVGESQAICQIKTIQISTYNYNLLAEFIHSPNFFAKFYAHQTFLLYSMLLPDLKSGITKTDEGCF